VEEIIEKMLFADKRFCLAIDGRCAAGKTTLAGQIADRYGCAIVHLDDFFLPKGMEKKGYGNLERDRLISEVLLPLSQGKEVNYRIFSCHAQKYVKTVTIPAECSVVIEGSYALLPEFRFAYTHSIFMTVSEEEQANRIRRRNGEEGYAVFAARWIPDEECYIAACNPQLAADRIYYSERRIP